jgi:hypothetical protein
VTLFEHLSIPARDDFFCPVCGMDELEVARPCWRGWLPAIALLMGPGGRPTCSYGCRIGLVAAVWRVTIAPLTIVTRRATGDVCLYLQGGRLVVL